MRFNNVDFALDFKITVDAFNHPCLNVTEFGPIISACRILFSSKFTNYKVEFTLAGTATLLTNPNNLFYYTSLY